jgi:hypothetical protein
MSDLVNRLRGKLDEQARELDDDERVALARVERERREIAIKLRILDEHFESTTADGVPIGRCTTCDNYAYPCPTVRLLAEGCGIDADAPSPAVRPSAPEPPRHPVAPGDPVAYMQSTWAGPSQRITGNVTSVAADGMVTAEFPQVGGGLLTLYVPSWLLMPDRNLGGEVASTRLYRLAKEPHPDRCAHCGGGVGLAFPGNGSHGHWIHLTTKQSACPDNDPGRGPTFASPFGG